MLVCTCTCTYICTDRVEVRAVATPLLCVLAKVNCQCQAEEGVRERRYCSQTARVHPSGKTHKLTAATLRGNYIRVAEWRRMGTTETESTLKASVCIVHIRQRYVRV